MKRRGLMPYIVTLGVPLLLACQTAARDTRQWRATDHDRSDSPDNASAPAAAVAAVAAPEASSPHARDSSATARAMQAWAGKCMRCHGQVGAGDGPDAAATAARNLTDETWQSVVSDDRIADSIRQGRGRMPAFALEPDVVEGLVRLVRQMGTHTGAGSTEGSSAAPASPDRINAP